MSTWKNKHVKIYDSIHLITQISCYYHPYEKSCFLIIKLLQNNGNDYKISFCSSSLRSFGNYGHGQQDLRVVTVIHVCESYNFQNSWGGGGACCAWLHFLLVIHIQFSCKLLQCSVVLTVPDGMHVILLSIWLTISNISAMKAAWWWL